MSDGLLSTQEMYDAALAAEQTEHDSKELTAIGNLRAGNSGTVLPGGNDTAGSCPRLAHLRKVGISVETPSADRHIMFAAGHMNEDFWYKKLAPTWKGKILREEEIPTKWFTTGGTLVTGRPDLVLCSDMGDPQLLYEMKMVASVWTARDVRIMGGGKPKFAHLCQAAHYMWQLGTPGRLVYTSYVDHSMRDFAIRQMPKGHECVEYNEKGEAKKILPFWVSYELSWDPSNFLRFRVEGTKVWLGTPISKDGIRQFYEMADRLDKDGLGERPLTLEATGEIQTRFSNCSYCPLDGVCGKHERDRNYAAWLEDVRKLPTTREIK